MFSIRHHGTRPCLRASACLAILSAALLSACGGSSSSGSGSQGKGLQLDENNAPHAAFMAMHAVALSLHYLDHIRHTAHRPYFTANTCNDAAPVLDTHSERDKLETEISFAGCVAEYPDMETDLHAAQGSAAITWFGI